MMQSGAQLVFVFSCELFFLIYLWIFISLKSNLEQ